MIHTIIPNSRDNGTGVEPGVNFTLQDRFATEAENWIGVKYRHRGTTKRGCDCTGLLIGALRTLGNLRSYELREYKKDWNLHAGAGNYICEELDRVGNEIPNNEAGNGDIPIFRFGKCLAHAGVIVDMSKRLFVHSYLTAGKCQYAILRNSIWSERWKKTYRLSSEKMAKYK